MMIQPVPSVFQVPDFFYYPSDNFPDFEYWFKQNITEAELSYWDRVYLPILFTSFFKRNQYGKNAAAIGLLQDFVDTLPADKKYFCIVQYDDGVLIDWKGKDVKVFSMSGNGDVQLPLVCKPHSYDPNGCDKDILLSFIGRVTHPIRNVILKWGIGKKDCYITSDPHSLGEYCKVLSRSRFVLCARGYGVNSFRVCESLQYGAMPIILNQVDDMAYRCPISVVIDYEDLRMADLDYAYSWIKEGVISFNGLWGGYRRYYTFDGVKKTIFEALWNLL